MLRSLTLVTVVFISSCLLIDVLYGQNQTKTRTHILQEQLDTLLKWFPGEYDNHEQVYKRFVDDVAEEKRHSQTHHIFHPVSFPFIPGQQIYAEQSHHYNRGVNNNL